MSQISWFSDEKTYGNDHEKRHGNESLVNFEKQQEFSGISSSNIDYYRLRKDFKFPVYFKIKSGVQTMDGPDSGRTSIFKIFVKTVPPVYIATIPRTGVAIPSKLVIPKLEPTAASFLLIAETIEMISVRPVKTS